MKHIHRALLNIAVVAMFLLLAVHPILAEEEVYKTSYSWVEYSIPWGNGMDDDGDGIIDNLNETDVRYGDRNISADNSTFNSWSTTFTHPTTIGEGVVFDAAYDSIVEIWTNENTSVAPTEDCWYSTMETNPGGYPDENMLLVESNTINVCSFYINLSAGDLMNGVQEFWYRSPLVWNDPTNPYTVHFLNIYDSNNALIYASPKDTTVPDPETYENPSPKYVTDGSSMGGLGGERVYYRLNFPFLTGQIYRFEEHVKTLGDVPINSVQLYMAPLQDIARDGETDTYVFLGSDYARKVPIECAWNALFTYGLGPAGTKGIVYTNSSLGSQSVDIISQWFDGVPSVLNTNTLIISIPIRTSEPMNISVIVVTRSGADMQATTILSNVTVTGTIQFGFDPVDPNGVAANRYCIMIKIWNWGDYADKEHAFTYGMHRTSAEKMHWVRYHMDDGTKLMQVKHFAMDVEILDEDTATYGAATDDSIGWLGYLVGIGLLIVGIILSFVFFQPWIGVPLALLGVATIVMTMTSGDAAFPNLLSGFGETINSVIEGIIAGTLRVVGWIVEGLKMLVGGLANVVVGFWEAVVELGSSLIYYGGIIFEAIAEIIWFAAAMCVMWFWAKFLEMMKWVTLGRPEKALQTGVSMVKTPINIINKPVKKGAGLVLKAKTGINPNNIKSGTKKGRWYK